MECFSTARFKWGAAIGLPVALVASAFFYCDRWEGRSSAVVSHNYQLLAGTSKEWHPVGGVWQIAQGAIYSHSNERGAKLLSGSKEWRDFTLTSDIQFEGTSADMGVIVRSNNESEGIFAFDGYYVGLRSLDDTLVLGRATYGWAEARPVPMPGGVHRSQWYRLRVTTYGCNVAASAQNLSTLETAWIAFEERSCIRSGRIGLRSLNAQGMWRNISITSASRNDYLRLQERASSVEQPIVPPGPPWWTGWHITLLFAGTLAIALLVQLGYFRLQQWKAFVIMQERDRLAHEVHDTMAQSFAGVGYQLQGIRSILLRGDRQELEQIPDKLTVAYQLVRRCHEDASRTIAMLGTTTIAKDEDLLKILEATTRRVAGENVRTVIQSRGTPARLGLHVSDALLKVGREAVVNAVTHSNLTVLTITLSFKANSVELEVEDNGQGFEYAALKEGLGILEMQKKARGASGTLDILSSPGLGTRVRLTVPSRNRWLRTWLLPSVHSLRNKAVDL